MAYRNIFDSPLVGQVTDRYSAVGIGYWRLFESFFLGVFSESLGLAVPKVGVLKILDADVVITGSLAADSLAFVSQGQFISGDHGSAHMAVVGLLFAHRPEGDG